MYVFLGAAAFARIPKANTPRSLAVVAEILPAPKGGFLDKSALDEKQVVQLASLPSRDELIAKVIGTVKAPLTRLVTSLSSPIRGLVYTLNAIKEKKQEVK